MGCKRKPLYHYVGKQKKKTLETIPSLSLDRENSLCPQAPFNSVRQALSENTAAPYHTRTTNRIGCI